MKFQSLEEKLKCFLMGKSMNLKKGPNDLYWLESSTGKQVTNLLPLDELYLLACDYLSGYDPDNEPVPDFTDTGKLEADRSDMTFAEFERLFNRLREMTLKNRRSFINALVRVSNYIDLEEKRVANDEH